MWKTIMAYPIANAIEVPIFLIMFALVFADSVTTNWLLYRTCYTVLKWKESDCAQIGTTNVDNSTADIIEATQPYVTVIIMAKTLIESCGAAIVCFFIGPWSDKYGRKPVLLLSFGGYIINHSILAMQSAIQNCSPYYVLICILPQCFTGGLMAIFSVTLSYITDTTLPEKRSFRITLFHAVAAVGYLLGTFLSSYALFILGYTALYIVAISIMIVSWLFIYKCLSESLTHLKTEVTLTDAFKFALMKTTVLAIFKKRDNYGKIIVPIIILSVSLHLLAELKDPNVYLYVQYKLHWTLKMFTVYNTFNIAIETVACLIGTYYLPKLFGVEEPFMIMLGFLSIVFGTFLLGTAVTNWMVYLASVVKCLGGITRPMAETFVSKIVPTEDTGKVFAFMAVFQNIIGPLGSPLFTLIYNNTLSTLPEVFIFVSAGLNLIGILLSIAMMVLQSKQIDVKEEEIPEAGKLVNK